MDQHNHPLRGKLALITGATGGIGSSTSHALAALGLNLALHYHTASDTANTLVQTLTTKYSVRAEAFGADLSSYNHTRTLHTEVVQRMGHPTVLFNNAGVALGKAGLKSIEDVSVEDFETTWRANCGSAFLLTQLCVPAMEGAGLGRIIFCSSVAGFTGGFVGPHYAYVLVYPMPATISPTQLRDVHVAKG